MKRDPAGDWYVYSQDGWWWVGHPMKAHEQAAPATGSHIPYQHARNRCDVLNEEDHMRRLGVVE